VSEGQKVTWGGRPEYLSLTPAGQGEFSGTVTVAENLGAAVLVTVELPEGAMVQSVVGEDLEPEIGSPAGVTFEPRRTLLFDADGVRIGD
jgi:multiple sugar transport system ATP-binding protein